MAPDRTEVIRAVDRLFRIASSEEARSLEGLANALSRDRGRPLTIEESAELPVGVFGQWKRNPDGDQILYASWVHARERTIGHEIGHIALGHAGRPAIELATAFLPESSHDLATLMLERNCTHKQEQEEIDAEAFASLLLRRIYNSRTVNHSPIVRSRIDEALG